MVKEMIKKGIMREQPHEIEGTNQEKRMRKNE
jgi:hypothetical protein